MNHVFNFVAASSATETQVRAYVGGINTDIAGNGTFYDYLASGTCLQNIGIGCNLPLLHLLLQLIVSVQIMVQQPYQLQPVLHVYLFVEQRANFINCDGF